MSNCFKSKALQEMSDSWILFMSYNIVIYYKQLVKELNIIIVYNDKSIYLSPNLINVISNSKKRFAIHFKMAWKFGRLFKTQELRKIVNYFTTQLLCKSYNFVHKHCTVGWIERCPLIIFWKLMIFSFENEHLTILHFWFTLIWQYAFT